MIPYTVFHLYEAAMFNVTALERLEGTLAGAHGQAIAMAGKNHQVQAETTRLSKMAYPEETLDGK